MSGGLTKRSGRRNTRPLLSCSASCRTREARSLRSVSRCVTCGYIPTTDQSDAGSAGVFPRRTNQMQAARVYSHDGPIGRRKRGYILTTDQSDRLALRHLRRSSQGVCQVVFRVKALRSRCVVRYVRGTKVQNAGVTHVVNTQDSQEQAPCATYGWEG
eukprot:9066376-Pyramimonas_sp.AAC.1